MGRCSHCWQSIVLSHTDTITCAKARCDRFASRSLSSSLHETRKEPRGSSRLRTGSTSEERSASDSGVTSSFSSQLSQKWPQNMLNSSWHRTLPFGWLIDPARSRRAIFAVRWPLLGACPRRWIRCRRHGKLELYLWSTRLLPRRHALSRSRSFVSASVAEPCCAFLARRIQISLDRATRDQFAGCPAGDSFILFSSSPFLRSVYFFCFSRSPERSNKRCLYPMALHDVFRFLSDCCDGCIHGWLKNFVAPLLMETTSSLKIFRPSRLAGVNSVNAGLAIRSSNSHWNGGETSWLRGPPRK